MLDTVLKVVQSYPILRSNDAVTKATLFDREEVRTLLSDILPATASVFSPDRIGQINLPIRVTESVMKLYDLIDLDDVFISDLQRSSYERNQGALQALVFLVYIMDLSASDPRVLIDRYKRIRLSISKDSTPARSSN